MNPAEIIKENQRRLAQINTPYDPYSGAGATSCERSEFVIADHKPSVLYLPLSMLNTGVADDRRFIEQLRAAGSFQNLHYTLTKQGRQISLTRLKFQFIQIRIKYDFEFWAASFIKIKPKAGSKLALDSKGEDVPFILNRGQRKYLTYLLQLWDAKKPIRIILLKARQWGGSTLTQIFAMWIQFVHFKKWNSCICAHIESAAHNIEGLYANAISKYPYQLDPEANEPFHTKPYMRSQTTRLVSTRNCTISIGTSNKPNNLRSSDISIAHFSEVAFYKNGENPEQAEEFVRNINSSVAPVFGTMIVYESTADGVGDFFHSEWLAAVKSAYEAQFTPNPRPYFMPVFVAWLDIESYALPIENYETFVSTMTQPELQLFADGATLEQINWYRFKASDIKNVNKLHSEFPSNPTEAFISTGRPYFNIEHCKYLESTCTEPMLVGDLVSDAVYGPEAANNIRFVSNEQSGHLRIWSPPDTSVRMPSRYVVVVDVNRGLSSGADNGIICVLDRYWMAADPEHGVPEVVAEWCGHEIMRYYAWTAVRVAKYYNNAYLVIESNTPESTSAEGFLLNSVLDEIGDFYDNMFFRLGDPEKPGAPPPRKYGYHTNSKTKNDFCSYHQHVILTHAYIERSLPAAVEHQLFEYKPDGSVGAAVNAHDDRVITRALGCYLIYNKMDRPLILDPSRAPRRSNKNVGAAKII